MTGPRKTYRITHLAGPARSGSDRTGHITHAVVNGRALCGKEPGRRSSGWSEYEDQEITCVKCAQLVDQNQDLVQAKHCAFCGNLLEPGEGLPSVLYKGVLCDACYDLETGLRQAG